MSTEVDIASRVWRNIGEDRMMLIAAGVMFYGSAVSSAPPGIRARSVQRQKSVADRHFFRQAVDEDLSGELAKLS